MCVCVCVCVCESGSALKCKEVLHEPEPAVNEDGGGCESGSVLWQGCVEGGSKRFMNQSQGLK